MSKTSPARPALDVWPVHCTKCQRAYTERQWDTLPLLDVWRAEGWTTELRNCPSCNGTMAVEWEDARKNPSGAPALLGVQYLYPDDKGRPIWIVLTLDTSPNTAARTRLRIPTLPTGPRFLLWLQRNRRSSSTWRLEFVDWPDTYVGGRYNAASGHAAWARSAGSRALRERYGAVIDAMLLWANASLHGELPPLPDGRAYEVAL